MVRFGPGLRSFLVCGVCARVRTLSVMSDAPRARRMLLKKFQWVLGYRCLTLRNARWSSSGSLKVQRWQRFHKPAWPAASCGRAGEGWHDVVFSTGRDVLRGEFGLKK